MRHSEIDKRAKRNAPRQCLSDYGHDVHKDAPVKALPQVEALPPSSSFMPLADELEQVFRTVYGQDFDVI
jgi:hypothetical protein